MTTKVKCVPTRSELKHEERWNRQRPDMRTVVWKTALPFVLSRSGHLVHRMRSVSSHFRGEDLDHVTADCWCGSSFNSDPELLADPESSILCLRCEQVAVAKGLPRSRDIVGHHVHTGRLMVVRQCCPHLPDAKRTVADK